MSQQKKQRVLTVLRAARGLIADDSNSLICFAIRNANIKCGCPLTLEEMIRLRGRVMSVLDGWATFELWWNEHSDNSVTKRPDFKKMRLRWLDNWIAAIVRKC